MPAQDGRTYGCAAHLELSQELSHPEHDLDAGNNQMNGGIVLALAAGIVAAGLLRCDGGSKHPGPRVQLSESQTVVGWQGDVGFHSTMYRCPPGMAQSVDDCCEAKTATCSGVRPQGAEERCAHVTLETPSVDSKMTSSDHQTLVIASLQWDTKKGK